MSKIGLNKAVKELNRYGDKQVSMIYPAAAIVLWQQFGYRKQKIIARFAESQRAWETCAQAGETKSMMQMMEEETGVELILSDVPSYHSMPYLDPAAYDGKPYTSEQIIYMRQRQRKWIAPQILASICIALHRSDGFGVGYDGKGRLERFITEVDKIRKKLGEKPKEYAKLLKEVTDIDPRYLMMEACKK